MPGAATDPIHAALRTFADAIHEKLGLPGASDVWPEDQLKGPVEILFKAVAQSFDKVAIVRTEAPRPADVKEDGGSRVDAAVHLGRTVAATLLTGHIELKAPSKSGDPRKLTGKADKDQWKKFQKLPNLIYTNGREWTLQRTGKQIGSLVRFSGDPIKLGANAVTADDAKHFEALARTFLEWEPIVPHTSRQIAELLAPLCRLLRTEALEALKRKESALTKLAAEVRKYLFPNASNEVVADAYAQTFTYALLIARFEGADPLTIDSAEEALQDGHGLLGEVLHLLETPAAHKEVETSTEMLLRVIGQVKPREIVTAHGSNPWLYFYEEFLAAYDPALRKKVGAYYTPVEVVRAQVAFVRELLIDKLNKPLAFADDEVVTLDPAVGTGTYPLGIMQSVVDAVPEHAVGSIPELLRRSIDNLYGIEYLIGPYAVAHLRMSRFLADRGVDVNAENPIKILLADTLASHEDTDQAMLPGVFGYEEILEERETARELKVDTRVVVCIGNPPYLRGRKSEAGSATGGWVTMRRQPVKGQKIRDPRTRRMVADRGERGIIKDFTDPATAAGRGADLKNLYNSYVYFWRWALWKVFEQNVAIGDDSESSASGIVSFITASSYLRGPGFVGMRQHMRALLDEIWIVDLGGDNKGGRKTENVFAIETPVAILTGVRYGEPDLNTPATVHYVSLADLSSNAKRAKLASLTGITDTSLEWRDVMTGWQDPFLPVSDEEYLSWPAVTDLFPGQVSGVQMFRSWPIGETEAVLKERWARLVAPLPLDLVSGKDALDKKLLRDRRAEMLHESRDRKVDKAYPDLFGGDSSPAVSELGSDTVPLVKPYAFRSFDRQFVIADARVGDYLRPSLWQAHSKGQLYLTSMLTEVLGEGPAAVVARDVPDYHHFRGSFGGRHVIPLWRDADATDANVTRGLLAQLAAVYGFEVSACDLFGYVYGLLSTSAFTTKFWEPLTVPGAHLPLTKDPTLFATVRDHGSSLIELHTKSLHEVDINTAPAFGSARFTKPVSAGVYPEDYSYDATTGVLSVGDGEYRNVAPEVWAYSVSGLAVVDSWLGYRMKNRSGKSGSELDQIRPAVWPDPTGAQLLRLLWVLEATVAAEKVGAELLDQVLVSEVFLARDLPEPSPDEREPFGRTEDEIEPDDIELPDHE